MLGAFVAVATVVIVTPGPDTALTIRSTLLGGRVVGVATAAGVITGLAVWTVAASVGATAVLVASEPAFMAVKLAGAAYLVFLGAQTLWHALRSRGVAAGPELQAGNRLAPGVAYRQGVISDLGNPKIAAFFTSLLPQFAPTNGPAFLTMLGLGFLFCAMTFAWLTAYAVVITKARTLLSRPRIRRTLDAVMGTVLIALGLRLATEPRVPR
jgi:threonine/homoserine/homoserine lactone efflux protein